MSILHKTVIRILSRQKITTQLLRALKRSKKRKTFRRLIIKQQSCPSSFGFSSYRTRVPCLPRCIYNENKGKFGKILQTNIIQNMKTQVKICTNPSARPHWPGREEMQASNLPELNCSSICESSLRSTCRFSIFLAT